MPDWLGYTFTVGIFVGAVGMICLHLGYAIYKRRRRK